MKVYFVDDDDITLFLCKMLSEKLGLDASFSENGEVFLNAINGAENGTVFLDIHMPVMDGLQVIKILQKSGRLSRFELVCMISDNYPPEKLKIIEDAGCKTLEKPITEEKIKQYVNIEHTK